MQRLLPLGVAALLLCPGAGRPDAPKPTPHEEFLRDYVKVLSDLADAFEAVKDKDTARAAAPKVVALAERLEALGKKVQKLDDPSKEEQKKLQDKYGKDLVKQVFRQAMAEANAKKAAGDEPDFKKATLRLEKAQKSLRKGGRESQGYRTINS